MVNPLYSVIPLRLKLAYTCTEFKHQLRLRATAQMTLSVGSCCLPLHPTAMPMHTGTSSLLLYTECTGACSECKEKHSVAPQCL